MKSDGKGIDKDLSPEVVYNGMDCDCDCVVGG